MQILQLRFVFVFFPPKEVVIVDDPDPATIKSPIYIKEMYVESLVSPRLPTQTETSLPNHNFQSCQMISGPC